jgi:hypothetical protein
VAGDLPEAVGGGLAGLVVGLDRDLDDLVLDLPEPRRAGGTGMNRWRPKPGARRRAVGAAALATLGIAAGMMGCGGGSGPRSGSFASGLPAPPTVTPTAVATVGGSVSSPPASREPSPLPSAALPVSVLELGAATFVGALGSWTLDGQGSDAPWLPAAVLTDVSVGGQTLTVRFADGSPVGAWSARAAPSTDQRGDSAIGLGERDEDQPPLGAVTFGPLPAGTWVVAVRLDRADGRGDSTSYWLVTAT